MATARSIVGALTVGLCLACGGGDAEYRELVFEPYRGCGRDPYFPELTLVRIGEDGAFIEKWGDRAARDIPWGYRARVRERRGYRAFYGPVPSRVVKVLEKEATPGLPFKMRACGPTFLEDDRRHLMDGKAFTCATPEVCAELDRRSEDVHARFDLHFRFAENVRDPLVLVAVSDRTCNDSFDCGGPEACCRSGGTTECRPRRECPEADRVPLFGVEEPVGP